MPATFDLPSAAYRLYLGLLLSPRPVSMSRCGSWGFADFGELLRLLSLAAERGWVSEASGARFQWKSPLLAESILNGAAPDDFRAVFERLEVLEWGLDSARKAAGEEDFARARVLYWALVMGLRPVDQSCSDGRWLEVVLEALRLFRREVSWLSESIQAQALDQAVALGDQRAEAVLLATRAYEQLRAGKTGEAEAWTERALQLCSRLDDADVRQHILLYVANNWILLGRLPDALSILESSVGDIPPDLRSAPGGSARRDTTAEASLSTLANAYAWTGRGERALELLNRMLEIATRTGQPLLSKMAEVYLAWVHADRGDVDLARRAAEAAFAQLDPGDVYTWFACQPLAWARMKEGRLELARELLSTGHQARLAHGQLHFQNSFLLDVLTALEQRGLEPIDGLTLDGELSRLTSSLDKRMRGVAMRFEALRTMSGPLGDSAAIDDLLRRSAELLQSAGAVPELIRTLREAVGWAERNGRASQAAQLRDQLRDVSQTGSASSVSLVQGDARTVHVARAIADMGRLTLLTHRREGFWGEIAARLCRELSVERCALLDTSSGAQVLAARGGDRAWLDELISIVDKHTEQGVEFRSPPGLTGAAAPAQLVLVPYRIDELGRRGWVCLETRSKRPLILPGDHALLESLGVQIGVLIRNIELWEELTEARQRLERENRYYREENPAPVTAGRMIGDAPAFRRLFVLIAKVGPTRSSALVLGETGVGKELVARELHRLSPNRNGAFIAVHVASITPGLVSSALFGHEKGAFTGATEQVRGRFELADGGTIFLDEIGELGHEDQVRLLRVLQEGTFERVGGTKTLRSDFRLIAATNRDLAAMVKDGRFREDLYYRLNVFPLHVPPLRDRREDIPRLALHFLDSCARRAGRVFEGIGIADMERLAAYDWPGNVRELEHVVERAVVLSDPPMLKIPPLQGTGAASSALGGRTQAWVSLEECERRYVAEVLRHTKGRITGKGGAAQILGLKPSTLQFRIDKLGLREALEQSRRS